MDDRWRKTSTGTVPFPLNYVLESRDVVVPLDFAHGQGVIHCDIKDANIVVDRERRFFLSVFGIAFAEFVDRGTMTDANDSRFLDDSP
jgi:serine/threonine protein kinase